MKKILVCLMALLLVGCVSSTSDVTDVTDVKEITDSSVDVTVSLSDVERNLLLKTYPFNKERIENNELYSHQVEFLAQYRDGMQYLKKYEPYEFEVLSVTTNPTHFNIKASNGESYNLIYKNGTFKDDLYNVIFSEQANIYVAEAFKEAGYDIAEIHSNFGGPRNINITEATLDKIKQYPVIMDLFIEASELNNYNISVILKQLGFKGIFYIYYTSEMPDGPYEFMREHGEENFKSFNIQLGTSNRLE